MDQIFKSTVYCRFQESHVHNVKLRELIIKLRSKSFAFMLVFLLTITSLTCVPVKIVNAETMVYVTKSGEKYHSKKCGRGNFYQDTLSNAKARGLEPCRKCFPNGAPSSGSSEKKSVKNSSSKKEVKLSKTSIVLVVKQTLKLKLKNTKSKPKWNSSDTSVATVNKDGKIKAKAEGKTVVTATVDGVKKKCKVKVENPKLNRTTMEIEVGSTDYLTLDGCSHEVEWSSDDDYIADVDEDGTVYGEEAGTTTITASVHGKEYVCTVVVRERQ